MLPLRCWDAPETTHKLTNDCNQTCGTLAGYDLTCAFPAAEFAKFTKLQGLYLQSNNISVRLCTF